MTPTTCPLCEATCGLVITHADGRATKARGDSDDPFSRGFLCPKGARLPDLHHDPDRLTSPRVRRNGVLVEASWEEAYAEVSAGLTAIREAHGRDAMGLYLGNPNVHSLGNMVWTKPLIRALRTPQLYSASTMDQMPRHVSCARMYGHPDTIAVPDIDRTELMVMLGANPMASNGSLATAPDWPGRLRALVKRGRLVVVDPVRTETAALATEHVRIRPGTDALLLAAWLHVALHEHDLPEPPHTTGYDALVRLMLPFSPEAVAERCDLPVDTIRSLGVDIVRTERAVVYGRMGVHTTAHGTLASWLTDALNAVTGHLDVPGGAMFPRSAAYAARPRRAWRIGRTRSRVRDLPEVRSEWPVATLADELLTEGPGQLRGLWVVAGNPALSAPDSARVHRGLSTLEHLVVVGPYLDETAQLAHVVLPPPGPLARWHYDLAFNNLAVRNVAKLAAPVLPRGDRPAEWEILARLAAIAQGLPAATPPAQVHAFVLGELLQQLVRDPASALHGQDPGSIELTGEGPVQVLDALLAAGPTALRVADLLEHPHGIDLGPLEPRLPEVLSTPSGRVELAPEPFVADLTRLHRLLHYESPVLVLVGRRHVRSNNSWMHNVPKLVSGRDRCTLWVHPEDARAHGLTDGCEATVRSDAGELTAPVELTDAVSPGVVSLPHGWGHHATPGLRVARGHPGVNSNRLTEAGPIDPLSGNAQLNAIPVSLSASAESGSSL